MYRCAFVVYVIRMEVAVRMRDAVSVTMQEEKKEIESRMQAGSKAATEVKKRHHSTRKKDRTITS